MNTLRTHPEVPMKVRLAVFLPAGPVPGWVVRLVGDCSAMPGVVLVAILRDATPLPAPDGAARPRCAPLATPEGVAEWRAGPGTPAAWLAEQGCDALLDLRLRPALLPEGPAEQWTLTLAGCPAIAPPAGPTAAAEGADDVAIRLEALRGGGVIDAAPDATRNATLRRDRRNAIAKGMGMVRRALLRLADGGLTASGRAPLPHNAAPTSAPSRFAARLQRRVARPLGRIGRREAPGPLSGGDAGKPAGETAADEGDAP